MSAGIDALGASTVLVSQSGALAANGIADTNIRHGASEADDDWQVL